MADTAQSPEELATNLKSLLDKAESVVSDTGYHQEILFMREEAQALSQFVELVKRWRLTDNENVAVEDWTTLGVITRLL